MCVCMCLLLLFDRGLEGREPFIWLPSRDHHPGFLYPFLSHLLSYRLPSLIYSLRCHQTRNCDHMANKSKEATMLKYVFTGLAFFYCKNCHLGFIGHVFRSRKPSQWQLFQFIVLPGHHSFSTSIRMLEA